MVVTMPLKTWNWFICTAISRFLWVLRSPGESDWIVSFVICLSRVRESRMHGSERGGDRKVAALLDVRGEAALNELELQELER